MLVYVKFIFVEKIIIYREFIRVKRRKAASKRHVRQRGMGHSSCQRSFTRTNFAPF